MGQALELATAEIRRIEIQLADLETQAAGLRKLRDAWMLIQESESTGSVTSSQEATKGKRLTLRLSMATGEENSNELFSQVARSVQEALESSNYGDKTNVLRSHLLAAGPLGMTRAQIVEASKQLAVHANFPYRFISRMIDGDELLEDDGRYYATAKMASKLSAKDE